MGSKAELLFTLVCMLEVTKQYENQLSRLRSHCLAGSNACLDQSG